MSIAELIALAKIRSGKKQTEMALEMGHSDNTRISKIAKGRTEANASEIIYLATQAHQQPLETLALFESEKHPELKGVWQALVGTRAWLNT